MHSAVCASSDQSLGAHPSAGDTGDGSRHCQAVSWQRWGDAGVSSSCKQISSPRQARGAGPIPGPGTAAEGHCSSIMLRRSRCSGGQGSRRSRSGADGPWIVWDHGAGDALLQVELFPIEVAPSRCGGRRRRDRGCCGVACNSAVSAVACWPAAAPC
jgi:hypothetical protein